ncbi:MAG: ZIP family magnesium transporter [Deltaproteobacteria bacterium]|nr:MAG: ZIP family magnesium transporter [Deltaproteobacteria bacterium]TMB24945.1 MAG: ZIP family magnesium transporter [Deltaproteobacteria bacterium]
MADARLGLGLLCVGLAAAANVLGGATVALRREWDDRVLRYCVALGAGFMLAAVLLKMLPESSRLTAAAPVLVLAGYLLIHLFEHTVASHFHFGEEVHPERMSAAVSVSALVGLAVHSFFDGLTIGSGFVVGQAFGLLLFAAVILHKAPEGFAIASVVLAAHGTRAQALGAAAAVGAASLLGGLAIFGARALVGPALAVSGGVTLYVAASDLVPEVNKEEGTAIALTVFAGVLLYYVTARALEAAGV